MEAKQIEVTDEEMAKAERVRKVLATLTPAQEMAMRLRFGIGAEVPRRLTEAEIAVRLGRSEAEVRALLEAGAARLRERAAYIQGT